jgi:hypothetical protein
MLRQKFRILALFLLALLMFLASGLHGSYFCVAPWTGGDPLPSSADAHP